MAFSRDDKKKGYHTMKMNTPSSQRQDVSKSMKLAR